MFGEAFTALKMNVASPVGRATGYFVEKHIYIEYKEKRHTFEVATTFSTWDELMAAIQTKFQLNSKISAVFLVHDGKEIEATLMSDLRNEQLYHIRTEIDKPGNQSYFILATVIDLCHFISCSIYHLGRILHCAD
jgi:hypothetical protein